MRTAALLLALLTAAPVMAETTNDLVPNISPSQAQTYTPQPVKMPSERPTLRASVPLTALAAAGVAAAMAIPGVGVLAAAVLGGTVSAITPEEPNLTNTEPAPTSQTAP